MFKDVIRSLDTGSLAIVGLVAFILAFVLIIARVVFMKKSERTAHKNLPLEDDENPHV